MRYRLRPDVRPVPYPLVDGWVLYQSSAVDVEAYRIYLDGMHVSTTVLERPLRRLIDVGILEPGRWVVECQAC